MVDTADTAAATAVTETSTKLTVRFANTLKKSGANMALLLIFC
jgi:hypothetical protein